MDQLQALVDALKVPSLNASARIEVLQRMRQIAAGQYLEGSGLHDNDTIDAMVLKACGIALPAVEQRTPAPLMRPMAHGNAHGDR